MTNDGTKARPVAAVSPSSRGGARENSASVSPNGRGWFSLATLKTALVSLVKPRSRRLRQRHLRHLRLASQAFFTLLSIWIGIKFYFFVRALETGKATTLSARPPGVEGYLPISGLIGLKYWILTGDLNPVHPAAILILLGALLTGLFLKKGFCGWICPIGFLSENLRQLGVRIWRKPLNPPRWLDLPLRSVKYLLMAFFLWAVLVQMNVPALRAFINSPYNKVADIKMLKFFTEMSSTTAWTLLALLVLSVIIPNFWCRYLCPYGALLGLLSVFSPTKITRDPVTCIDCKLCTHACPMNLRVHTASRIASDECNGCLECIAACPVPAALQVALPSKRKRLSPYVYAALVVGVFSAFILAGKLTGHWQTSISVDEYRRHVKNMNSPLYQHTQGRPAVRRDPLLSGGSRGTP